MKKNIKRTIQTLKGVGVLAMLAAIAPFIVYGVAWYWVLIWKLFF